MADHKTRAVVADLSGGRNGVDAPTSPRFSPNQCLDAVNVDFWQTDVAHKRNGMTALGTTGMTMTGTVSKMHRHVPSTDDTAAELWANDDAATVIINRLAGGTTWAAPTLKDNPTGNGWEFSYASLNGLCFLAYKSAQDRLHCWDGSTVRRAGLPPPTQNYGGIILGTNTGGAGTYAATKRYYRIRWTKQVGGVTVKRSESLAIPDANYYVPDGAHASFTVTRESAPGEDETHWELEGSTDNASYYVLATIAAATSTYVDSADVSTYPTNPASPTTGTYTLQKSYRFIAADQGRLLGFGSWTSTDKQNDIEVSGVIGSLNIGDVERVDTTFTYRYTLDELDGGPPTGLQGPVLGNFYAFKPRQLWELAPTGSTSSPYRRTAINKAIGCVQGPASCIGEDAQGNGALYFMSHRGVYRYGIYGLQYIGKGCEDYVIGPTATINLAASKVIAHLRWHSDKKQLYVWFATGSSNDPNVGFICDVGKNDAWSRIPSSDKLANARCSTSFSNTVGSSMSRDLKPYIGYAGAVKTIYKADDPTATDDGGTAFQAYVDTRDFEPGGPGFFGEVGDVELFGKVASGVTLTVTTTPNFDSTQAVTSTALLTASGSETRRTVRAEGSGVNGAAFVRYRIGDGSAVSNAWSVDRLLVPHEKRQARTA